MSKGKSTAPAGGAIRTGISGWLYEPWRGAFYPKDLKHKDELKYAASKLSSIEINGTFYSLKRPENFQSWAADVPDDFVFAVKGPQFITHIRRLKEVAKPLANFFASGLLCLGKKLGPILWQLPPNFKYDAQRFEEFFELLPHDMNEAVKLARLHDAKVEDRAFVKALTDGPVRHAIEVRHASCEIPEYVELLRKHNVALVCTDSPQWPRMMDVTADFVYCRLHGAEELYVSGYDDKSLREWAKRAVSWSRGEHPSDAKLAGEPKTGKDSPRDVFIYFDNDAKVLAPRDAQTLRKFVDALRKKAPKPNS
jgi:uncharacterized protein YecE (DUF72 family)